MDAKFRHDNTIHKGVDKDNDAKSYIIDFALRNTDINLWYFNCETGECLMGENCQEAHEMPGEDPMLYNFPECLIEMGYVREDSVEPLRAAYAQLWKTGKSIEIDVWFRKVDGSGWWCERDMLTAITGPDDKIIRGIGVGKDVTAEKELLDQYRAFQSHQALRGKSTMASFRMNLTTGQVEECASNNIFVLQSYKTENVEDFFRVVRECTVEPERDLCEAMFCKEYLLESFLQNERNLSIEYRYRCHQGQLIWLRTDVNMMKNPTTGDVEALLHTFNIDYQKNGKAISDKLLKTDYEFIGLVDTMTEYLTIFGENKDRLDMTTSEIIYDEHMTQVFQFLIQPEYLEEGVRTMTLKHVVDALKDKPIYTCSFPTIQHGNIPAGRKQWKFEYLNDSKEHILVTRTDITEIYTVEYDELTGLYNRQAFYRHAREVLDMNPDRLFLLIRFDVDRFKALNDVRGSQEGDRLLARFGRIARDKNWPQPSVFGRLQSDHFVTIIPADSLDVPAWHEKQKQILQEAIQGYRLTSSVGVYEINNPKMEISLMCDRALMALRTVKDNYTTKIAWYNEELRDKLMEEQMLCEEMEMALEQEQFVLYFQPQIEYSSGAIIGAEALVRWKHPKHGLISPGQFIPVFEKNGFIVKLDNYVWEKSCQYLRKCLDTDGLEKTLPISVNISRCDLYDRELSKRLKALIDTYSLPPSILKLEITESAYMDNSEQLIEIVQELRQMGFTVQMDDFGAGYSSLNMLKDVPVDVLKLDLKFLSKQEQDSRGAAILSSVIRMANLLELPIIAEGVENIGQAKYLHELGCKIMQGYYFGYPMPEEEFIQLCSLKNAD